ncbi:MAG: adenosylmethionine decarboxylase [bacterium]
MNTQVKELEIKEEMTANYLGRHILVEFFGCCPNVLNNTAMIEEMMVGAAKKCGATVVTQNFHTFSPYGVSGVVIIAESHLTIHTWPEMGYAAVDLFTCGETCDPWIAYEVMKEGLCAGNASYSELKRGMMSPSNEVMNTPFEVKTQI